MMLWLRRLGMMARVAAICGTVAWLAMLAGSPYEPDVAHPIRYAHRHVVRYVSTQTDLALQILFFTSFTLAVVAVGCHLATRDA